MRRILRRFARWVMREPVVMTTLYFCAYTYTYEAEQGRDMGCGWKCIDIPGGITHWTQIVAVTQFIEGEMAKIGVIGPSVAIYNIVPLHTYPQQTPIPQNIKESIVQ